MLTLKVVTPDAVVVDEIVDNVSIPTTSGMITVLNKHAALVSTIKEGEMIVRKGDTGINYAVYKGVVNVRPHTKGITEVVVLLESSEKVDELDEEIAQQAIKRAEELLLEKEEDFDFGQTEAIIERELNKVKIARKYRVGR
jgi:F-type H+-transporting ATPase subunit epsilon